MKKETKTYNELNELQKLKIAKVLKYKKLQDKLDNCKIIVEGNSLKYIIIDDNQMLDIEY